jgi:hypothetical protein
LLKLVGQRRHHQDQRHGEERSHRAGRTR